LTAGMERITATVGVVAAIAVLIAAGSPLVCVASGSNAPAANSTAMGCVPSCPKVAASFSVTDLGLAVNTKCHFVVSDTATVVVSWNWGDGTFSFGTSAWHKYAAPGTYYIAMAVDAANGSFTSTENLVKAVEVAPYSDDLGNATQGSAPSLSLAAALIGLIGGASVGVATWLVAVRPKRRTLNPRLPERIP
jgi:PKD repeat protein